MSQDQNKTERQLWEEWEANSTPMGEAMRAPDVGAAPSEKTEDLKQVSPKPFPGRPYCW